MTRGSERDMCPVPLLIIAGRGIFIISNFGGAFFKFQLRNGHFYKFSLEAVQPFRGSGIVVNLSDCCVQFQSLPSSPLSRAAKVKPAKGFIAEREMSGAPDFFYREALRLGYVARSAFKLLQIQNKYKLITQGSSVLDLGCAPGAWLQVACQSLGPIKDGGSVVGIDLKTVKVPKAYCDQRVQTISADVLKIPKDELRALSPKNKGFKVILSDMCPSVSGVTTKDAVLSAELGMCALEVAIGRTTIDAPTSDIESNDDAMLQPGGHLVIKLLESEDTREFSTICKPLFRKTSLLRPKATRPSSREIYLICQGLLQQAQPQPRV